MTPDSHRVQVVLSNLATTWTSVIGVVSFWWPCLQVKASMPVEFFLLDLFNTENQPASAFMTKVTFRLLHSFAVVWLGLHRLLVFW